MSALDSSSLCECFNSCIFRLLAASSFFKSSTSSGKEETDAAETELLVEELLVATETELLVEGLLAATETEVLVEGLLAEPKTEVLVGGLLAGSLSSSDEVSGGLCLVHGIQLNEPLC